MRDIFINWHGNLLRNWSEAFPKAVVATTLANVPNQAPILFWLQADAAHPSWLSHMLAEIISQYPAAKIVVLANSPSQSEALSVMRQGVMGYCHAYSDAKMLIELKTVVSHGGVWLGHDLLQTLINATQSLINVAPSEAQQTLQLLTLREQEVAIQAASGRSNKEIARQLNIAERTVKAHISSSLARLGLRDRLQLALVLNDKSSHAASFPAATINANNVKKKLELAA